jgi:hypothetical protein
MDFMELRIDNQLDEKIEIIIRNIKRSLNRNSTQRRKNAKAQRGLGSHKSPCFLAP